MSILNSAQLIYFFKFCLRKVLSFLKKYRSLFFISYFGPRSNFLKQGPGSRASGLTESWVSVSGLGSRFHLNPNLIDLKNQGSAASCSYTPPLVLKHLNSKWLMKSDGSNIQKVLFSKVFLCILFIVSVFFNLICFVLINRSLVCEIIGK